MIVANYRKVICNVTFFTTLISVAAFGGSATQTDWHEGDVEDGPVTDWGYKFSACTGIDWGTAEGDLTLFDGSMRHNVDIDVYGPKTSCPGDFDGDGDIDLAVIWEDGVIWYENENDAGGKWAKHVIDNDVGIYNYLTGFVSDVDGDSYPDFVGGNFMPLEEYARHSEWWENNGDGTSWTAHNYTDYETSVIDVCACDIDGDQDIDMVGSTWFEDGGVVWWENKDGYGTDWESTYIDDNVNTGQGSWVWFGDLDDDEDTDVVGTSSIDDTVYWFENVDGSGDEWKTYTVDNDFYAAREVNVADVDGDSDNDIIGIASGEVAWWENDGTAANWTKHCIYEDIINFRSVFPADLDGDDDVDVVTGSTDYPPPKFGVTWFENTDGEGTEWSKHTIDPWSNECWSVAAADINGDEINDITAATNESCEVYWYEVGTPVTSGNLTSSILYIPEEPDWGNILWDSVGDVKFQVRSSNNSADMGDWSIYLTVSGTDLSRYCTDGDNYFQYKTFLDIGMSLNPTLRSGTVNWTTLPEPRKLNEAKLAYELKNAQPNPTDGKTTIKFVIPEDVEVELTVYDLAGRSVATLVKGILPAGEHEATVSGLTPGVYVYRLIAGDFNATRKMVIVE